MVFWFCFIKLSPELFMIFILKELDLREKRFGPEPVEFWDGPVNK